MAHKNKHVRWTAIVIGVAATVAVTACGSSSSTPSKTTSTSTATDSSQYASLLRAPCLNTVVKRGSLRVGVVPGDLPDDTMNPTTQKPEGFVIDLLQAFINQTGLAKSLASTSMPFGSLIPSLQTNKIDITGDTMFYNPDRAKQINFTTVIEYDPEGLVVQKGNPHNLHQLSDFKKGNSVATYQGTVWVPWLNDLKAQGASTQIYPTIPNLMSAVSSGRVQGGIMAAIIAAYDAKTNPGLKVQLATGYTPKSRDAVADHLGIQKSCPQMQALFDSFFSGYVASGQWATVLNKWGVTPVDVFLKGVKGYTATG